MVRLSRFVGLVLCLGLCACSDDDGTPDGDSGAPDASVSAVDSGVPDASVPAVDSGASDGPAADAPAPDGEVDPMIAEVCEFAFCAGVSFCRTGSEMPDPACAKQCIADVADCTDLEMEQLMNCCDCEGLDAYIAGIGCLNETY